MLKRYVLCLLYSFFILGVVRCRPDYLFHHEAGGWLKLHSIPATWEEAFLTCYYEGAVLASPLNKQIAKALRSIMSDFNVDRRFFLGTHNLDSNGHFASVEGVPLSDMEIIWGPRSNITDKGDCLTMHIDGGVHYMLTSSCHETLPFVCYTKLDNKTLNDCGTFDNEYHYNRRTGSCYKVHHEKQAWSRAYRICAAEGGYLVILNDKEEARIIKDMFPIAEGNVDPWEAFHIGLLARGEDRAWITIHGEPIEKVFHDWQPGQPDNYGGYQDHGAFIRAGTLDDISRTTKHMFVCEKSPTSIRFEGVIYA